MNRRLLVPAAAPSAELDLRLAVAAGGAWLAMLACLARPPRVALVVAVVALMCGVSALLASGLWSSAGRSSACSRSATTAVALIAFCIALELFPLAGRLAHSRDTPLAQLAAQHAVVALDLTITSDPRVLMASGTAGAPRMAVRGSARSVSTPEGRIAVDGGVLVLGPATPWSDIGPGQRVRVDGTVQPSLDSALSVTLVTRSDPVRVGRPPWWQRLAADIRASLREASSGLPVPVRGLLPGLVDGDTSGLDPVLAEHFRLASMTHLVAVSGTNA